MEETELAGSVHECLEDWVRRMSGAVLSGRSATTVARMATARALAELRRLGSGAKREASAARSDEYLRRAVSMLTSASREIERNRYSLVAMQEQLERLDPIYKEIVPDEPAAESSPAGDPAVEPES
jgi:hypothetical protein